MANGIGTLQMKIDILQHRSVSPSSATFSNPLATIAAPSFGPSTSAGLSNAPGFSDNRSSADPAGGAYEILNKKLTNDGSNLLTIATSKTSTKHRRPYQCPSDSRRELYSQSNPAEAPASPPLIGSAP
ncbi:uncharacterized protein N7503_006579 [Penicillium pulvis]|uniref:uncharacterized protein n=1 Tax=Penicillium pulvis TaxID=1562058 RepID=UPI0025490714|nr:uncharacterized protein N7503_006579 [Penicillium pulvis]KAJ5797283.1 hypothetical protein N7503_006579 [Penicillium pulvis]